MADRLILEGTTSLELSAKGAGSDVRSWAKGKVGAEGARLFLNNIAQPGTVDTIINRNRGRVGIGTSTPSTKLHVETGQPGPIVLVRNTSASGDGIRAESQGGHGLSGASQGHTGCEGFSEAGNGIHGGSSRGPGVLGESNAGTGVVGKVVSGAFIYEGLILGTQRKFAVTRNGDVLADGAHTGPADFAEMLEASGSPEDYEAGDVLVVGADGKVTKTCEPYDADLVGVFSALPGFLGDDRIKDHGLRARDELDDATSEQTWVPVALMGVVPVKVSDENGGIRPGDLLTTCSEAGYAMRADPTKVETILVYPTGTILGKALEPHGSGKSRIKALVMLR
ncbi:MAG TPA: hypothetical protein VHL54_06745 [Actinomycetota bacterium]|nr:hypothetical protein [Actinomycetota bacterium]